MALRSTVFVVTLLAVAGCGQCCTNILSAWGPNGNHTIWDAMIYRSGNLTGTVPFELEKNETADGMGYNRYITMFAMDDTAMLKFINDMKLSIHSFLTMDQQWLRTILYTHAVPAINLPFKVGDVYPTFNPSQNITVAAGREKGEVMLRTDLTYGYINTTDPHYNACQIQWYDLDGILLPPLKTALQLNTQPAITWPTAAANTTLGMNATLGIAG
jgi:hypothetical protein